MYPSYIYIYIYIYKSTCYSMFFLDYDIIYT